MLQILVVDDDIDARQVLAAPLLDEGHAVEEAADGAEALERTAGRVFDLVFCDIRLPKIDGLTVMRHLRRDAPQTAVVLVTGFARVADVKAALREGAYDYLTKPLDPDLPRQIVARVEERRAIERTRREARVHLDDPRRPTVIVGRSAPMMRLLERLEPIAQSSASVLLTGESGTGKELIARALHERGPRSRAPFVALNCASLPDSLLEAELFGHERGAFTGAVRKRDGRFFAADGGTLLLDEVAEISPAAQVKLLRVLQEGTFEPVGSSAPVQVDVRIIAATHRQLKELVAEGRFREDLYYRLNVLDLEVPPLRERRGDLPLLIEHFLRLFTPRDAAPPPVSRETWQALSRYPFPGNVRELAHAIERAVVLSRGGEIRVEHLPPDVSGVARPPPRAEVPLQTLSSAVKEFEREYLLGALQLAAGRRGRAAELLGISRKNLWEKLRAHGIVESEFDEPTGPHPMLPRDQNH